jgi:hypothetical protein
VVGSWGGNRASVRRAVRVGIVGRATLLVGVAGLLLLPACGGDGDRAGADEGRAGAVGSRNVGGAEPPGSDVDEVRPYIADLLDQHDDVLNQILADPGVARDRDDLLIQQYVALYEPGSDFPDGVIAAWVTMSDAGEHLEPYQDGQEVNDTVLTDVTPVSDDEVRFTTCHTLRYRSYDAGGQVVEEQPGQAQVGEGVAVRVDGEWRLRRIDTSDVSGCATPGGS